MSPKTREEIEQMKAAATGTPSSAVARRGDNGGGIAIPEELQRFVGDQLSTEMVLAAISQPSWKKALEEGGIEAVAQALYICKTEGLSPHRGHLYVFRPDRTGPWQAMISAYGYAALAGRKVDNQGHALFQGIRFEEAESVERGPDGKEEPYIVVKATVHWQGGGFSEGEGRKPRYQKRKDGSRVWDKDAEGKAETMAARRAFQVSPFSDSLPLNAATVIDEPPIRVPNEAEQERELPEGEQTTAAPATAADARPSVPPPAAGSSPSDYADMRPQPLERAAPPGPDAGEYEQPPLDEIAPPAEPAAPNDEEIARANETARLRGAASVVFTSDVAFANWIEKKMWGDTRVPAIPEGEDPLNHAPLDVLGEWVGELEKAANAKRRKQ